MRESFEQILWEGIRQFVLLVKSKNNFRSFPKFIKKILLKKRIAWFDLKITKSKSAKIKFKELAMCVNLKLNYLRINKLI